MQREEELYMTGVEFDSKCRALFSQKRSESRKAFCKLTGCTEATVSRYASGKQVIPLAIANLLFALELLVYYEDDISASFGLSD
jgi:hypothetical protein